MSRVRNLGPPRDSLFWRSPNYYPNTIAHTLSLMAYFARQAQRVGRSSAAPSLPGASHDRGLRAIDVMREPRQSQTLNYGRLHFSDREVATRLLEKQDTHSVPIANLGNRPASRTDVGGSASLAEIAPLLGIKSEWLPEHLRSASSAPQGGLTGQKSGRDKAVAADSQAPWFEVRLLRRRGAAKIKNRKWVTQTDIEAVEKFEGFDTLIRKFRQSKNRSGA
ncbi:unnamed protein product [Parajaminaea phylloscopi]